MIPAEDTHPTVALTARTWRRARAGAGPELTGGDTTEQGGVARDRPRPGTR